MFSYIYTNVVILFHLLYVVNNSFRKNELNIYIQMYYISIIILISRLHYYNNNGLLIFLLKLHIL